jgi:hypothetical protein
MLAIKEAANRGGLVRGSGYVGCQSLPRPHFTVAQAKADDIRFSLVEIWSILI